MYGICFNQGDEDEGSGDENTPRQVPDRSGLHDIMKMDLQSSQFDSHCEALMFKLANRLGNSNKT